MAFWIFSKLKTETWLSSLPATIRYLPSGVTSTPCGLLGSGIRYSSPSAIDCSMGMKYIPFSCLTLPALTSSSAFFQLVTCRKSVSLDEQPASKGGRPRSMPPT